MIRPGNAVSKIWQAEGEGDGSLFPDIDTVFKGDVGSLRKSSLF